ncbi:MAG: phosphoribosyltransferase [Methanosarcina sp.]|nr:phosphoribosyltransferase [Methanosarcina sp.]MDD3873218.1 phosphoribosyltransferase [Methanosarcina sp.]MDD4523648.1 phosphoribosyltransferase [Methanosarcina sp.]HHV24580.1 phosphoribosyltransferase [Methanosarcina sp.]
MESFKCVLTNWDYIYNLCRNVSNEIKCSGYEPDVIIALARGGWFAGRVLCDFLGLDDLSSLKIEHYVGTAAIDTGEPYIRYPLSDNVMEGKKVLIVDDIVDTGESMLSARAYVEGRNPTEVRTASLQYLRSSKIEPDYVGERLEDWAWIVYPWNFMEDMISILTKCMKKDPKKPWCVEDLKHSLYMNHALDSVAFEITQPGRLPEVLEEMERVRRVSSEMVNGKKHWRLL